MNRGFKMAGPIRREILTASFFACFAPNWARSQTATTPYTDTDVAIKCEEFKTLNEETRQLLEDIRSANGSVDRRFEARVLALSKARARSAGEIVDFRQQDLDLKKGPTRNRLLFAVESGLTALEVALDALDDYATDPWPFLLEIASDGIRLSGKIRTVVEKASK